MLLSREDKDLGVASHAPPGSQASPRGESMDSALLPCRDTDILVPPEWPQWSPASFSVWREDPGLLSRPCRKRRPSAREDGGVPGVSSSCGAFFSCLAWRAIPSPLSKLKSRLDSLEATQWAPRDPPRGSRAERSPLLPLEARPDSPGEHGMQPRDPCPPWRGALGPGHKTRDRKSVV